MIEKLIFLTGHRKSGTSLFHKLFDGHPDLCVYPVDVSILYAYFPFFTDNKNLTESELTARLKLVLKKSLSAVIEKQKHNVCLDDFVELVVSKACDLGVLRDRIELLSLVLESWAKINKQEGKPIVVKETSQAIHYEELKKSAKIVKFISIIRDPRDNWAAIKAGVNKYYKTLGESDKEAFASLLNRARMDLLAAKEYTQIYPNNFFSLRFEELVSDTNKSMREIVSFLEISYSPCLLMPTSLGSSYSGNNHDNERFIGIETKNVNRWKERISPEEAKIIEFWLGDVMKIWGYKKMYPEEEALRDFSIFYSWYNSRYFYHDSFSK